MRSSLTYVFFAGLIFGYYAIYPSATDNADASQAALTPSRPVPKVIVSPARKGALQQSFSSYGEVRAVRKAEISAQTAGQIIDIFVKDGEVVKKGAVLVSLDDRVARADLKAAQARLDAAKADLARASRLVKRGTTTPQALQEAQVKLAVAESELALKQAELERYKITAPFDGQIGRIVPSTGTFLSAGTAIAQILDHRHLRVDFQLPERLWGKARPGQAFEIRADGNPALRMKGTVSYISPDADPKSRSMTVSGLIDNRDNRFTAGLFVYVSLDMGMKEGVTLVPEQALIERLSGSYIYVVAGGKSHERKVETGVRKDGLIEIVSGVKAGEKVVTGGQKLIRDNMAVSVAADDQGNDDLTADAAGQG